MKKEQERVFTLLKEIDEICRKNRIPYFLAPGLALRAVQGLPFPDHPLAGEVLMKTEDMERFRLAFEKTGKKRRALESMCSHKFFPGFYLRYEDLDSTCYIFQMGKNLRYHGMGVSIRPLWGIHPSEKKRKILEILETGWLESCYVYGVEWKTSDWFWGMVMRILCVTGRAEMGRRLYRLFLRTGKHPLDGKYVVKKSRTDIREYSAAIFERTGEAVLEGYSFCVPAQYRRYLKEAYGERWAQITPSSYKNKFTVITSAEVGCEEFMKEAGSQRKLLAARRRQFLRDLPVRKTKERFEKAWDHVKLFSAGSGLKTGLRRRRDFIFRLYECRDYSRLEVVFRPYTRWIQRCMDKGDFYPLDEDIMNIYLTYLRETARDDLAERIRAEKNAVSPHA